MHLSNRIRHFILVSFLLALICLPIFFFVVSTQSTAELNLLDNPWYLNRARLIWRGILPDLFVYTLAYPTLVGLIDQLVQDAILAGMLANTVILWLILIGTYLLGCWLYDSKRVAALAVLLVVTNVSVFSTLRLFWASAAFTAAVVWCLVICLLTIRRPVFGTAILLGAALALAAYTRFEGALYTILVPISAWIIYRQNRNWRLAISVFFTTGITFVILVLPFVLNFVQVMQSMDRELSTNVSGIITLLSRTPIEWDVIWRRMTDTLTGFLLHWPSLAWLVGIAGVIWAAPRFRNPQWLITGLIGFNIVYTFVLAIWPYPIHIVFYIPLLALVIAATLDQLIRRKQHWRLLAILLLLLIVLPGLSAFASYAAHEVPMAYRSFDIAQTGERLDLWLEERGLEQIQIYTFCDEITSFSRSDFQILYRLQWATGWDTPDRLIARMRYEGAIMMDCGDFIPFADRRALFEAGTPPGLTEIGRFDKYVFYRPDDVQ